MLDQLSPLCRAKDMLESICLSPRITAGIAVHNKMTGAHSGNKSVTLSFHVTLLRALLWLLGLFLFIKGALCLCRIKRDQMLRKKYRNKGRRRMKK
ncbi:MAG: hypothetical protein IKD18_06900 [Clostridia bacterium]|nr:hypothetical protein [Clostridia bacterium]